MNKNSVFITGIGACAATGDNLNNIWNALIQGETGIAKLQNWVLPDYKNALAGEIKEYAPQNFLPDRKLMKFVSKQDVLGIYAACKAIDSSNMINFRETLLETDKTAWNDNTGVYVGSPGNKYMQQYDFLPLISKTQEDLKTFGEQIFTEIHPMWLLRILPNNVLAYTGITYGFKGPNHNIVNHAVGGMQAILEAYYAILNGEIERAVVVAYDLATEPQAYFYYDKLGILTNKKLLPFDAAQSGTVLAEGAAAIVLESGNSIKERNGHALAEMLGGASQTESGNLFGAETDGTSLAEIMQIAIQNSSLNQDNITAVVAHGNGNTLSDHSEIKAINQVFGAHHLPITGFKWSYGHTIVASGLLDTVSTVLSLMKQQLPGIPDFNNLAEELPQLNVINTPHVLKKNSSIIINNRGFGGMNASVVIRGC